MPFTGNYICKTFGKELLFGAHDFSSGGDVYKLALYTDLATLTADTEVYTTTGEITGTGYTAGGLTLTNIDPVAVASGTALLDFEDAEWSAASITARGGLVYNTTPNTDSITLTNPACLVFDFGSDKTISEGTFRIRFPMANASNAVFRLQSP